LFDRIFIATFSRNAEKTALEYGMGIELNDLCISSNLDEDKFGTVLDRMRRRIDAAGQSGRKVIMHGPFTELSPASIDHLAVEMMLKRYRQTLVFCERLGINDLVLHDGYLPLIYHKDWHKKRSVAFWKSFAEELPEGMTVYVENVFDDEPFLLTEIIGAVGRDSVKICLDVGHANAMRGDGPEVVEWIKVMAPLIGHFHLHNNDGTADLHNDIDCGTMDIRSVLETINGFCSPDVTLTVESRESGPSVRFLREYFCGGQRFSEKSKN